MKSDALEKLNNSVWLGDYAIIPKDNMIAILEQIDGENARPLSQRKAYEVNINLATDIRYGAHHLNSDGISADAVSEMLLGSSSFPDGIFDGLELAIDAIRRGTYDIATDELNTAIEELEDAVEGMKDTIECSGGDEDWDYVADGYRIQRLLDNDMIIMESPYYTMVNSLCSPCVPNAADLDSDYSDGGWMAYCLGPDWFDEGKQPYRIFRVEDGKEVGSYGEKEE